VGLGLWSLCGLLIVSVWDTIHPRSIWVRWTGLLWSVGNVPKHSFCAWLSSKIGWILEIGFVGEIVRFRCHAFFVEGF